MIIKKSLSKVARIIAPLLVLSYPLSVFAASDDETWAIFGFLLMMILIFMIVGTILLSVMAMYGFTIWMIVDAVQRDFEQQMVWLVLMLVFLLFFPFVGFAIAFVYYFAVRRKDLGTKKDSQSKKSK
ncbi:MAG: hypothetical protein Q8P90_01725 [bacterium]|nr:hypothetical protein [bacterium]